mmetsp:Transcript_6822/g.21606  ORF Transcript_6822/g.21606 Transcript_6822/m.21606 type:complete len:218 (+) Transcript_6822:1094-1747(+)
MSERRGGGFHFVIIVVVIVVVILILAIVIVILILILIAIVFICNHRPLLIGHQFGLRCQCWQCPFLCFSHPPVLLPRLRRPAAVLSRRFHCAQSPRQVPRCQLPRRDKAHELRQQESAIVCSGGVVAEWNLLRQECTPVNLCVHRVHCLRRHHERKVARPKGRDRHLVRVRVREQRAKHANRRRHHGQRPGGRVYVEGQHTAGCEQSREPFVEHVRK